MVDADLKKERAQMEADSHWEADFIEAKMNEGVEPAGPMTFAPCPTHDALGNPRSPEWPSHRKKWLEENPQCAICGCNKCLQVHHRKPFHLWPELELDFTNYITLCECPNHDCHIRAGHLWSWKSYNPRIDGDIAAMNNKPLKRDETIWEKAPRKLGGIIDDNGGISLWGVFWWWVQGVFYGLFGGKHK